MGGGKQTWWSQWLLMASRGSPGRGAGSREPGETLVKSLSRRGRAETREVCSSLAGCQRRQSCSENGFWMAEETSSAECWSVYTCVLVCVRASVRVCVYVETTCEGPLNIRGTSSQPQARKWCLFLPAGLEKHWSETLRARLKKYTYQTDAK